MAWSTGCAWRIAEADSDDEQQLLRLESDARRVQIVTLHKSKGLEYPLVFLPFVGIGRDAKVGHHCDVPDIDGRSLHWHAGGEAHAAAWHDASEIAKLEQRAEEARLLYVGLTRAQHALWLATGPLYHGHDTALAPMLADLAALDACDGHRDRRRRGRARHPRRCRWRRPARCPPRARSNACCRATGGCTASPSSAMPTPAMPRSRRTRARRGGRTRVAADARTGIASMPTRSTAASAAAASATCCTPRWSMSTSRPGPIGAMAMHRRRRRMHSRRALRAEGYADADLDDGIAALTPLVGDTLTVALPEGGRLCDLPADARRAEIEFHFALQPTVASTRCWRCCTRTACCASATASACVAGSKA